MMKSVLLCLMSFFTTVAIAEEALVAVATNFVTTARDLQSKFHATSDHSIVIATGSTGLLVAQIGQGAPYDVLLAADADRPQKLVNDGFAISSTRFTYAYGRLLLIRAGDAAFKDNLETTLVQPSIRHIALANPRLAPYGLAALQTMQSLKIAQRLESKFVFGANVGQTFAQLDLGNADLGFVARSQLSGKETELAIRAIAVPQDLHEPIRQDAVMLIGAKHNPAAAAFLSFLRGPVALDVIRQAGYSVE